MLARYVDDAAGWHSTFGGSLLTEEIAAGAEVALTCPGETVNVVAAAGVLWPCEENAAMGCFA